ncbi:MAG TPA: AsmA-like C-terminal region-containing protein [Burkholderiales bacterium]|nr:AsmA-like C-terminal region-containing protein [Burkholderiales bacterium]
MKWLKRGAIAFGMVLALLALLPFFFALDDYIPHIEREASAKLKEPVSIQSIRASVLPVPHLTVKGIAVGRTRDVKIGRITMTPDLWSLLGTVKTIRMIEVDELVLNQAALERIPLWAKPDGSKGPALIRIGSIRLEGAVVVLGKTNFGPFDAHIRMSAAGEPQDVVISTRDGALKATIKPDGKNYLIDAAAKSWKLPLGPPIRFDELTIKGTATLDNATFNELNARLYGGRVSGNAALRFQKGLQLTGRFDVRQVELRDLVPLLSPGSRATGKLDAKPVLSAKSANASQFASALRVATPFSVHNGVLYGVDIQKAATNLLLKGPTGGETRFDELSGHLLLERGAFRFTQLKVVSGALGASGNVTISQSKELSGRISAQVKAGGVAAASVPLNVSGTVQSPLLLPTAGAVAGAAVGTAILGPGVGTSVGAKVGEWTENLFGSKEQKR